MEIHGIEQYVRYIEQSFGLEKNIENGYTRYTFTEGSGEGYIELFHLQDKFQIWITHAKSGQNIDMSYTQDESSYIGMSYVETEMMSKGFKEKKPSAIHEWRMTRSLPSDDSVYGIYKADMPLHAVNIILFKDFFFDCAESEEFEKYYDILKTIRNFDEQSFMREFYPILAEMLHCSFKLRSKKLFMKSRAYEIAAKLIALYDTEYTQPNISLSKFDIEQIRQIPAILEECMANPPSISALSRMVALNEFKLKAGFKKIFNTTIYEYLRKLRTEKAVELMKEDLTLEQICEKIGYKSMRGFSQAFIRCAGISPAEWRKQRSTFDI